MKIMSLNVWQGRLGRVLSKHLETLDVDFACMQEAVDYDGRSSGLVCSYKDIGRMLRLSNLFFSPLMTMKLGHKDLIFGNSMFSNNKFLTMTTEFTRGEYKADYSPDIDDYNIRAFQHATVESNGKKLHILNHHGHHIDEHKLGDEEALRQIMQILDYLKTLEGAVILCGDFNLSPESESIKRINGSLHNLSVEYGLKTTRSKLTYKNEVCDYIFVNDHIKVKEFVMDETIISDHNALVLDFDII